MLQTQYLYNKYSALFIKIGLLIIYLFISFLALTNKTTLPIYVDVIFFLLFLDLKNILNLKNYYCVYVFLIFKLSSQFFYPDDYKLTFDGTLYMLAFLLGYEIKTALSPQPIVEKPADNDQPLYEHYVTLLKFLIKLFIGLKLVYIIFLITQYGISGFYSGQMLADRISNFGRKSTLDSILTIYSAFVDNFLMATIVLYVKYIAAQNKKPDYYLLSAALLALPLLILSRSAFAFNVLTLLLIYSYFSKSMVKVYTFLIPGFMILFIVSTYIGLLRLSSYNTTEDLGDITSGEQFFTELTPIVAYKGVTENIHILHYQYGKTIALPLVTKVIPRSLWTTKPENSSAYYNREFDYYSFAAGFSIPTMIFGDLFLNFGMYIALGILFLFGLLIARSNLVFVSKNFRNIDNFLILFVCFYSLIRNCLPEGLTPIILMLLSKKVIEIFVLKIPIKIPRALRI